MQELTSQFSKDTVVGDQILLPRDIQVSFFFKLAIGFYMLIFQPPVNICSDKNIQTIFGTKLEDFLNYRIDYDLISQTFEKVVKNIFCYHHALRAGFSIND
jgi:hypothetical protein